MAIGVPSAIKTFNWIGTLVGRQDPLHHRHAVRPRLRLVVRHRRHQRHLPGQPSLDLYFHDTYFVVGHFHLIMGVAAIFGMFAGTYYWFPKMFGRMMNETLGKIHFWLTFIGVYAIFTPMHYPGPRRAIRAATPISPTSNICTTLMPLHKFMTHAAYFTAAAQIHLPVSICSGA